MCKRILKNQTSPVGDVPFFKIGTFGGIADAYISREIFNTFKANYPYPKKGQVLLSAAGTIGRSVIFDGKDAYFQDSNIIWIDSNVNMIDNKFLHYCFKYFVDWNRYKTDGSVISRLYNDDLRSIEIPSLPLDRQIEISNKVDELEHKISDLEKSFKQKEYLQSLIVERYLNSTIGNN